MDAQRKAIEARLIQKVYEVDPLACPNGGATMRIITLIDDCPSRLIVRVDFTGVSPGDHIASMND